MCPFVSHGLLFVSAGEEWEAVIEESLQHKARPIHTAHLFHLQKFAEVRAMTDGPLLW